MDIRMKSTHYFKVLALCLLCCALCCEAKAQSLNAYKWQTLNCVGEPIARHEAAFVEANGKFYLLGGRRIQNVSIFNPKTNTWESGAKPPIELHHFEGFSYKGNIYVVGAHTGKYPREKSLKQTYLYQPATDKWVEGFEMPENRVRASHTAKVYKNKLYIAGGIVDGHWEGHVKWFDCYDFATGKWSTLPDIPRYRDHASSVIINNKLYLIGGRVSSGAIGKVFELTEPMVDVYDFKTGKWETLKEQLKYPRAGATAVAMGNKIIIAGGESMSQKLAHNEVECYDTQTGEWSVLPPLNNGRHGTQIILYKKKLYIASGSGNRGGKPELTSIERFSK